VFILYLECRHVSHRSRDSSTCVWCLDELLYTTTI